MDPLGEMTEHSTGYWDPREYFREQTWSLQLWTDGLRIMGEPMPAKSTSKCWTCSSTSWTLTPAARSGKNNDLLETNGTIYAMDLRNRTSPGTTHMVLYILSV